MNNVGIVVDASAVIALLVGEPFTRFEPSRLANASISAVNLSEVLARFEEIGMPECAAASAVARLNLRVIAFGVLLTSRAPTSTGWRPLERHR